MRENNKTAPKRMWA